MKKILLFSRLARDLAFIAFYVMKIAELVSKAVDYGYTIRKLRVQI